MAYFLHATIYNRNIVIVHTGRYSRRAQGEKFGLKEGFKRQYHLHQGTKWEGEDEGRPSIFDSTEREIKNP